VKKRIYFQEIGLTFWKIFLKFEKVLPVVFYKNLKIEGYTRVDCIPHILPLLMSGNVGQCRAMSGNVRKIFQKIGISRAQSSGFGSARGFKIGVRFFHLAAIQAKQISIQEAQNMRSRRQAAAVAAAFPFLNF
tara:strand:- start:1158 stop:1556 length:399 start_codon:yes stop_codon:yes gene_type:complete